MISKVNPALRRNSNKIESRPLKIITKVNPVLRRNNNKSETRPGKKITKASGDVGIGYEYESDGGALTMI